MSGLGDSSEAANMSSRSGIEPPHLHNLPKPRFVQQQSNSVPSTPRQHPRDFAFDVQTPSEAGQDASDSPRSTVSEINRAVPSVRTSSLNCRYQNTQVSRRRIEYTDNGTDRLPKVEPPPKATLNPEEEEKLKGDMRTLYDQLLPTSGSSSARGQVVDKLQTMLTDAWPGKSIRVAVFGSSGNLLYTSNSDVDVCVIMPELQTTCALADLLAKRGMQKVTCVHAKAVPIVKIWDPELNLACDLNVNNQVAVKNTKLVKTYIELDERVRPLAMIVKHWTKKRVINEASGGTLSSYTWTLLLISFLQTRQPPVLPVIPLFDLKGQPRTDFADDLQSFRGFGGDNKESMAELLFQFFRHYGHEFDYDNSVVSVRAGGLLTKTEKNWQNATNNMLCVEEPFNTDRNLANTADDYAFRGLHVEFRQAFDRLLEANDLDTGLCEQFEFPEGGTRTVFERPVAQPKPILTRSQSQSGRASTVRGNGNTPRGNNRYSSNRNGGSSNRRSSNPATYNQNLHGMMQSPQYGYPPADYLSRASSQQLLQAQGADYANALSQISQQLSSSQLQNAHGSDYANTLKQLHQSLSNQEHQLRAAQIANMQQQAVQRAQNFAQSQGRSATLPPRQHGIPALQSYRGQVMGSMEEPPAVGSSHRAQAYSAVYDSPLGLTPQNGQRGTDTNPSSPLLSPALPRRQNERPTAQSSANPATRSQSQPARGIPQPYALPRGQYNTISGLPQLQMANSLRGQNLIGPFMGPSGLYYMPMLEQIPREYLGYGYGTSAQYASAYSDHASSAYDSTQPPSPVANQTLGTSLPEAWLRSDQDPDVAVDTDNISRSEPGPSQPIVSSGPVIVNGSRSADTPRHSPQRRRTMDLPYHPGPGLNVGIGNTYQAARSHLRTSDSGADAEASTSSNGTSSLLIPSMQSNDLLATSPEPLSSTLTSPHSGRNTTLLDPPPQQNTIATSPAVDLTSSRRSSAGSRVQVPPLDLALTASPQHVTAPIDPPAPSLLSPVRETNTPAESPVVAKHTSMKQEKKAASAIIANGVHDRDASAQATSPPPPMFKAKDAGGAKEENIRPTPKSMSSVTSPSANYATMKWTTSPPPSTFVSTNTAIAAPPTKLPTERSQNTLTLTSNTPGAVSTSNTNANQNPWLQATGKKKKGKSASVDRILEKPKSRGEARPDDWRERKGG